MEIQSPKIPTGNSLVKRVEPTVKQRQQQSSLALTLPPPPPPKRIKRPAIVLDEDMYIDGLSHIIARDYFPSLLNNEAKQDFLDAIDSRNAEWIQNASRRLQDTLEASSSARRGVSFSDRSTPSPSVVCTPRSKTRHVEPGATNAMSTFKPSMSLAAYQARYTSEDNESFNVLLDNQNLRNRANHAYLWHGNQIPSSRQIAFREAEMTRLASAETANELTLLHRDDRPAMPCFKKSEARNALMFVPESIEDSNVTRVQEAEAASNAPPKAIVASNTRMAVADDSHVVRPSSPSLTTINKALRGELARTVTSSTAGNDTPRVGGYAFVDAEPTLAETEAHQRSSIDPKVMLTSLSESIDLSPNPFVIKSSGKREAIHHRLLDKKKHLRRCDHAARQSTDGTRAGALGATTFKTVPKLGGGLTPAARMLYAQIKGHQTPKPVPLAAKFDLTPRRSRKRLGLLPGVTPRSRNNTSTSTTEDSSVKR